MSGPIRNERTQATGLPARAASAPSPTSVERGPSMEGDVFNSSPEQLKAAQAVIVEAGRLAEGKLPLSNEKKKAFVAEAKAVLAQAEQAESRLFFARDGQDRHAGFDAVSKLRDKVALAERRMGGDSPLGEPLNPFRPLFQVTKASEDLMSRGGLWAIIGIAPLIVAPVIDTMDLVSRPIQAVVWPFHALGNVVHKHLLQPAGIG